jgi:2'-5' RNA ligase
MSSRYAAAALCRHRPAIPEARRRVPETPRCAVYFVPEPSSALARFGRAWLGCDVETGEAVSRDALGLDEALVERVTATPAVYGLHATLKAPFRLAKNRSMDQLEARLRKLAASQRPFPAGRLALTRLGGFLALTAEHKRQLGWLAAHCTVGLDVFRAPLTDAERARRRAAGLSAHQVVLLETFGYPYVLSEFTFHITLTGNLEKVDRDAVEPVLRRALEPVLATPLEIGSLCLAVQPAAGERFRVVSRFAFSA